MKSLNIIFVFLMVFTIIDAIWLGIISKNMYRNNIGHLMNEKVNFSAAAIFYLAYILVFSYWFLIPAIQNKDLNALIINAMLFGFITYATYDLTNLATLKDWPLKITIIDLCWGMFITTVSSVLTFIFFK